MDNKNKLTKTCLKELCDLYVMAKAARDAYGEATKAAAQKILMKKTVLNRFVKATAEDMVRESAEESELFLELVNADE